MTEQEELARVLAENEQLRAIVQVVATGDTTYYDDEYVDQRCVFCHGVQDRKVGGHERYQHEPECIVTKARVIIGQGGKP